MSEDINKKIHSFGMHGVVEIDDSDYKLCRKIVTITYPHNIPIKQSMQMVLNIEESLIDEVVNIYHVAANEYSVSFFLTYGVDEPMVA